MGDFINFIMILDYIFELVSDADHLLADSTVVDIRFNRLVEGESDTRKIFIKFIYSNCDNYICFA